MPGAATQVFSREFDAALARIPGNVSAYPWEDRGNGTAAGVVPALPYERTY